MKEHLLKRPTFKGFFIEVSKLKEQTDITKLSHSGKKRLLTLLSQALKTQNRSNLMRFSAIFTKSLKKSYISYTKRGFEENNKGLKGWRLNLLKDDLRRELKGRINNSLMLIKTQDEQRMSILKTRFLSWLAETESGKSPNIKETLKVSHEIRKNDRHYRMILADQTRKMIGNFDNIVANKYQALGFFWKTRRDNRVTGKPGGKNPKGNEMHGDHYARQDKFYFYHNNWAIQQRLINTNHKLFKWADFEDGLPGQPINCRCYAYNIYELEDIPKELLSEKGKAYLQEKQEKLKNKRIS